jgi:hypothetical protein
MAGTPLQERNLMRKTWGSECLAVVTSSNPDRAPRTLAEKSGGGVSAGPRSSGSSNHHAAAGELKKPQLVFNRLPPGGPDSIRVRTSVGPADNHGAKERTGQVLGSTCPALDAGAGKMRTKRRTD